MKIEERDIAPIKALGYDEDEARFLDLVAVHSGYFVLRQFIDWTGQSGKRPSLGRKVESRGHGCWRIYPGTDRVYHLFSETLYHRIGRTRAQPYRHHSLQSVKARLILLDFVIANRQHDYLETEQQKVDYFCQRLALPKESLPVKRYAGRTGHGPTWRYFADKYPLFLDSSDFAVTFSFVDPGYGTLKAFTTHLDAYRELLYQLSTWRFFYISTSKANLVKAQAYFSKRFRPALSSDISSEVVNYFRLRKAWDLQNYWQFSNQEIQELNVAAGRFQGERIEALYSAWSANRLGADTIAREFGHTESDAKVSFLPYLVNGDCFRAPALSGLAKRTKVVRKDGTDDRRKYDGLYQETTAVHYPFDRAGGTSE